MKADSWRTEVGHLSKAKHGKEGSGEEREGKKWGIFPVVWGFFGVFFFSSLHVCEVDMGPNMAPSRRLPRVPRVLFALRCVEIKKTLKRMKVFKTSHVSAMRPMGITAVPLTFSRFNLKKPFLP